jgi:hypothetical protein
VNSHPQTEAQVDEHPTEEHVRFDRLWDDLQRNPWAGGNILRGEIPRVVAVTALPTASVERRLQLLVLDGGTGVADIVYVCIKNASDTYEWLAL